MSKQPQKVNWLKAPPEIKRCNCNHEVQDRLYGKGLRVMNPTKKDLYRCTVCGKERQ